MTAITVREGSDIRRAELLDYNGLLLLIRTQLLFNVPVSGQSLVGIIDNNSKIIVRPYEDIGHFEAHHVVLAKFFLKLVAVQFYVCWRGI